MKPLDWICALLLVAGGLNWAMWGLFETDLIASALGGSTAVVAKGVYALVGLAAVYQMLNIFGIQTKGSVKGRVAGA
ncbi:MAG: DUF378 domain-containing protein [Phycisphaeraceae bacterium]|nr:DUF378 domain-containing protein [Phycisphaeraceae bacterium]MCB9847485.1 DUF378 domain-containing protein [Phycisphaeraceae bacterium]